MYEARYFAVFSKELRQTDYTAKSKTFLNLKLYNATAAPPPYKAQRCSLCTSLTVLNDIESR